MSSGSGTGDMPDFSAAKGTGADWAFSGPTPPGTQPQGGSISPDKLAAALGKLGGTLTPGNQPQDQSKLLRIQAGAAPYDPGGAGLSNLLTTLINMHRQAAIAETTLPQQRNSLLG